MKKILLFILLGVLFLNAYGETEPFYFMQISDTHFGFEENLTRGQQRSHYSKYRDFVRFVNEEMKEEIKFLALTGDITENGVVASESFDKGMGYMNEIKYPIHYLPGNHDIDPEHLEGMNTQYDAYKEKFGEINYVKEYNGVRFIFLYAQTLRKNVALEGYDALAWLKTELQKNKDQETILLMHTVPGKGFYISEMYDAWDKGNEEAFYNLIRDYNIKAIIGGHTHLGNYDYLGDIPLITVPAFMSYDGDAYAYRLYKYENGKLSFFTEIVQ